MKIQIFPIWAFALVFAVSNVSAAEDAKSLDQLLQMIEKSQASETKEYKQREAEFNSDKKDQARLLKKAQDTRTSEERRSDRLEQNIRDNEQKIIALRTQLDKRLGSLKELFGHLTGAAGDIRANLN